MTEEKFKVKVVKERLEDSDKFEKKMESLMNDGFEPMNAPTVVSESQMGFVSTLVCVLVQPPKLSDADMQELLEEGMGEHEQ